jgi:hypothetical protein
MACYGGSFSFFSVAWNQTLRRSGWVTMWRPSAGGRRGQSRGWNVCGGGHRRSWCCRESARSRRCRHTVWYVRLWLCIQLRICWCSSSAVTTGASKGRSNSRWLSSASTASPVTQRFLMSPLLSVQRRQAPLTIMSVILFSLCIRCNDYMGPGVHSASNRNEYQKH